MEPFVVRLPRGPEEEKQMREFIISQMFSHYGSRPAPAGLTWACYKGNQIVGTLGYDECDKSGVFPFQRFYEIFETQDSLVPECGETIAYSRWVTITPNASLSLLSTVTNAAIAEGKRYGWSLMKPGVATLARRIGVQFKKFQGQVRTENLTPAQGSYYSADPKPELYLVQLDQVEQVTRARLL